MLRTISIWVGVLCACLPVEAFAQSNLPIEVRLRNSGSSYQEQFSGSIGYAYGIQTDVDPTIGVADVTVGTEDNTLKVTFTPIQGAVGSTRLVVSYFTTLDPIHPATRTYHFYVSDELITLGDDFYVIDSGSATTFLNVLLNDIGTAAPLHVSAVTIQNGGSATINSNQDGIDFTPDSEFTGEAWIQYVVCDSTGQCDNATAVVLVRNPNQPTVVSEKKFLTNKESLSVLTPFPNFELTDLPSNGTVTQTDAYNWVYTPAASFVGRDTFTLSVPGVTSRNYFLTVLNKVVNTQVGDDKFYVRPGLTVSFNVLTNDLPTLELSSFTQPQKGTLTELSNGTFSYTPNANFKGVDKFTYTACFNDTAYCETATVLMHVTDLEPESTVSYKLQTTRDVPLVIEWPLIYTDFAYIISDAPDNGTFTKYDGLQEIPLPCTTLEGYNTLVYRPDSGFTGSDHFEYYYCVTSTNTCYKVNIDITVIDPIQEESCPCVTDCIWPGDADRDGRVDMADLLVTGFAFGQTGLPRAGDNTSFWYGQHSENWPLSSPGRELKYADADGNGRVDEADFDILDAYYNRTHDVIVKDVQQKLPYQFSMIPVQFSLDSGDVVILDISIGNAQVPVLDMQGIKFSVNIPEAMMDSSTVQVTFHENSWLGSGSANVSKGIVPWDGKIDAGFAKVSGNKTSSSGHGVIATITFIIEDDLEGFKTDGPFYSIPLSISEGQAMGSNGEMFELDPFEYTLQIPKSPSVNPYSLALYPNPASDLLNVHVNGKTTLSTIHVYDLQGRMVMTETGLTTKQHVMHVSHLAPGLYYLEAVHANGKLVKPISVIR